MAHDPQSSVLSSKTQVSMTLPPEKLAEMHLKMQLGKGKRSTQNLQFCSQIFCGVPTTDLKNDVHLGLGIMIMFTQSEEISFGNIMISCFCFVKILLQPLGNMRLVFSPVAGLIELIHCISS